GLLRMGAIVNLLSHPVIIGFTNAAAIIIALSQLDKLLGVPATRSDSFIADLAALLQRVGDTHGPTLAMGLGALAVMLVLRRWRPRWPNVLIAVVLATLLSWAFGYGRTLELPLAAVRNEQARSLIGEVLERSAQLPPLQAHHAERRAALEALRSRQSETPIGVAVLESEVAILGVQIDEVVNEHRARLAALRRLDFVALDAEDGKTVLWLAEAAPTEQAAGARRWRIHTADSRGLQLRSGGAVVGAIPAGLPDLAWPKLNLSALAQLFGAALVIALVGFMEAISIAKAMAAKTRAAIDPNQELIGQGLANLSASVSQSFPVSGSFSRSAVNISAGAVSGLSSVFSAGIVLLTLLFLTPLLFHLPQSVLAGVIMMAVIGLINFKALLHAWQIHRHDGWAAGVTFVATLAFAPHLDMGILFGVVVAIGLFLHRRMRPRAEVQAWQAGGGDDDPAAQLPPGTAGGFVALGFDGALIFVNVAYFEDAVLDALARYPGARALLVIGTGINEIDVSGVEKLHAIAERLREAGVTLYLSSIKPQVMEVLARAHLGDAFAPERIYKTSEQAVLELQQRYGGAAA
ncbi:MAG: SulP family inorganic anion transporter, partial [Rhizobacter sp.]|nr:SulP family inorganic anion transporter [Rhizobacter sp.]